MATKDDLTIASLDGTARRLLDAQAPRDRAILELRAITTDPRVLGRAAGAALGTYQAHPEASWQGADIAQLLTDAGADPIVRDQVAEETRERLAAWQRGVGG